VGIHKEWVYINNRRVGTEERCYVHRKAGFYFGGGTKATVDKGAVDMAKTKTFSVKTQKDPDTLVKEARQVAKENDATLEGDSSSGRFSGKGVEGNYEIEGQTVEVTITEKPTLAPWSKVESKVREFFE
jgi:hypothetical protein